ncbi:MAG: glycosyltransferase family 39 protein [Anaerolineae bacterium]
MRATDVKATDRHSQVACLLALIGIIWLGAVLRVHNLGATSLWTDEINVVLAARGSLLDVLQGAQSHYSAPPLDYFIVHLLATDIGKQEFVLRFGAVAWSILSIPLAYHLGRQAAGRWAGVVAALLLATSPLYVGFSRQVKFYAALTFFALLSNVVFVRALGQRPNPDLGLKRWRPWLAHGLVNVAGIYFHPYVALILLCQGVYLGLLWLGRLVRNRFRRCPLPAGALPFLLSAASTALLFAPWFFWDMAQQAAAGDYSTAIDGGLLQDVLVALGHEHALSAAILALLVLCSFLPAGQRRRPDVRPLLALNVLSIGLVVWSDNVAGYWFAPKQMLFALPAYLVLAAAGLASLHTWIRHRTLRWGAAIRRPARWMSGILLPAMILVPAILGAGKVVATWDREKQNWRAAANLLEQEAQANDAIAGLDRAAHSVAYYGPHLPIERLADKSPAGLARLLGEHPRLWYIRDLDFGRLQPALEEWIQEQGFTTTDLGGVLVHLGTIYLQPGPPWNGVRITTTRDSGQKPWPNSSR